MTNIWIEVKRGRGDAAKPPAMRAPQTSAQLILLLSNPERHRTHLALPTSLQLTSGPLGYFTG